MFPRGLVHRWFPDAQKGVGPQTNSLCYKRVRLQKQGLLLKGTEPRRGDTICDGVWCGRVLFIEKIVQLFIKLAFQKK